MLHSLTGGGSIVHADVDSVCDKLLQQTLPHLTDHDPQRCLILSAEIEDARHVSAWHNQGLALGEQK